VKVAVATEKYLRQKRKTSGTIFSPCIRVCCCATWLPFSLWFAPWKIVGLHWNYKLSIHSLSA